MQGYYKIFDTCITISLCIGVTLELAFVIFGNLVLKYFFNMQGLVLIYGYEYLCIAGLGICLNMLLFNFSAYFKSTEKTSIFIRTSIISNIVNILIDYLLVFGKLGLPKLGVMGAAIGTIVGLLTNTLIYYYYFKKFSGRSIKIFINKDILIKLMKSYIPLVGQDFIESSAFILIITSIVTSLGTVSMGAYNLIMVIINIIILPVYAFGNATLTLVAKTNGSKDTTETKRIIQLPFISMSILSILLLPIGIILLSNFHFFGKLVTNNPELIYTSVKVIKYAILIQFFNMTNQILKYALNAIEDANWVLIYTTVISALSLYIVYLLSKTLGFGLIGIFCGLGFNYIILTIGFLYRYIKKHKQIQETSYMRVLS